MTGGEWGLVGVGARGEVGVENWGRGGGGRRGLGGGGKGKLLPVGVSRLGLCTLSPTTSW